MINVSLASTAAVEYLKNVFPDATQIQLEEVEITDDKRYWIITLSYDNPDRLYSSLMNRNRKYKIFKIDAENGEVLSMKIRELS